MNLEKNPPKSKRVTRYKGAEVETVAKVQQLLPMNDNQKLYIDALKNHTQVIVVGPSGTGKTFIAATYAANQYLTKKIDKIIITRPAVSVGKTLGALPGTLDEKFSPWLFPVLSVLEECMGKGMLETAVKNGNIVFAPLEYMRGSSYNDAVLLCDECFTGDTEILTENGFIRLDQLDESVKVFQVGEDNLPEAVYPSRIINKDYEGSLVTIGKERFKMTATAGHDAVYWTETQGVHKRKFSDDYPSRGKAVVAGTVRKPFWRIEPVVVLTCALQADGSYLSTKTSAGNYTNYWTVTLKRQEKIDRLRWALTEVGVDYTEYAKDKSGRIRFYIPNPPTHFFDELDLKSKTFDLKSIVSLRLEAEFLEEVMLWDGSVKGGAKVYCSTNKANIDVVQALAHLCGKSANFGVQYDKRPIFKKEPKPYYRLNVSDRNGVDTQKFTRSEVDYKGRVYCVTVPSGMIYVRQNGRVFITGNCQNLDVAQFKMLVTRIGENCQLVMNGDIRQSDIKEQTGLGKAIHLAKKYNIDAAIVEFTIDDVVRSDVCKQWLVAFDSEGL